MCLRIQFTDIIPRLVTTFLFLCNTSPTLTDTCLTAPLVSKYCSLHHYHLTWVIRYIKTTMSKQNGVLLIVALIILWCISIQFICSSKITLNFPPAQQFLYHWSSTLHLLNLFLQKTCHHYDQVSHVYSNVLLYPYLPRSTTDHWKTHC